MIDHEKYNKVIDGLQNCLFHDCYGCPYDGVCYSDKDNYMDDVHSDARSMLRELYQETLNLRKEIADAQVKPIKNEEGGYTRMEPIHFMYECPVCSAGLMKHWVACPICGTKLNWK